MMLLRLGSILVVALLAYLTNLILQEQRRPGVSCDSDGAFSIPSLTSSSKETVTVDDSCRFFSSSYRQARTRFRTAAVKANAEMHVIPVVSGDVISSDDFTIDVAIVPGTDKTKMIVHSSGVHGVEGYAGSAIQLAVLDQYADDAKLKGPSLVLIHAVNPYGMAHMQRVNEHNVDLNRNALEDFQSTVLDPKVRPPNVANYDDLIRPLIEDTVSSEKSSTLLCSPSYNGVMYWWDAIQALRQHGFAKLKRAMVAGQYHHSEGIFFGGNTREPSIRRLDALVTKLGILDENKTAVWIDVHTGLGKFGMDTLLVNSNENNNNEMSESILRKTFSTPWTVLLNSVTKDMQAMSGYDLTVGLLIDYMQGKKKAQNEKRPSSDLFMVQEFGTKPGVLVGRALMLDHRLRYSSLCTFAGSSLHYLQRAFYPDSSTWRRSVLQRGVGLVQESLEYIMERK